MSFFNIRDPEVRDATIADYLKLQKRLKRRNLEERSDMIVREKDLEENFKPVVTSNKKMTEEIIKDLVPIKDELKGINENLEKAGMKRKLAAGEDYGPLVKGFFKKYLDADSTVDRTFGIRFEDGKTMMGDEVINIDGDNIVVNGAVYKGTPGLWTLISSPNPKPYEYTQNDYKLYKELLYETNAMYRGYDSESNYPRANKSKKWKKALHHIWEEFKRDGIVNDNDDDEEEYHTASGEGLLTTVFHPIKGSRIYLQKNGRCFNVQSSAGNGLFISPRPQLADVGGNGLYLRVGSSIYDGKGLLLGPHSPFKNIPILKWIL